MSAINEFLDPTKTKIQSFSILDKLDPAYDRLFVYGIFLDRKSRMWYGMINPRYACVPDFATFGGGIVMAHYVPKAGLSLTGLMVDMPKSKWKELDRLEARYDRIKIKTVQGYECYMYAQKGTKVNHGQ